MSLTSMVITIGLCVLVVATYKIWKPWLDRGLAALKARFGSGGAE